MWGVGDALGYGMSTARRSKREWGPGSMSKTPVRTWPVLPRTQGKSQTWSPHARPLYQKQTGILRNSASSSGEGGVLRPVARKNRIFPWSRRPSVRGPQPPGWVGSLFPMSRWLSVDLAVGERVRLLRGSAPSCNFSCVGPTVRWSPPLSLLALGSRETKVPVYLKPLPHLASFPACVPLRDEASMPSEFQTKQCLLQGGQCPLHCALSTCRG